MLSDSDLRILTIVLSTVIPVTLLVIAVFVIGHRRRQRRFLFLKRGITPIDDEEIESWRTERTEEKKPILEANTAPQLPDLEPQDLEKRDLHQRRQQSNSISSLRKPPSVIIYQNNQSRASDELSPRSLHHKRSVDIAATPILARAPNSRPGLTDETIQGDDAFLPPLKRQPSRLAKMPPLGSRHNRTQSSRSANSGGAQHEHWYGQNPELAGNTIHRQSSEHLPRAKRSFDVRRNHHRTQTVSIPTRASFDDEVFMGGLSPRPLLRNSEIGRAIG